MPQRETRSRTGLLAATLLLATLLVTAFFASTPQRSPARTSITWAWKARYLAVPVLDRAELVELHANAALGSREQCVACHGDKTGSNLLVHRIHLRTPLLSGIACHECHQRVDLAPRDATSTVKWVDVGFCKKCHSAFPGLRPESHMRPEDLDVDCTMCHTGARAIRHAQPYLPQIIPPSECKGCHGGRVLPWTPRHEQDDWVQAHGEEALRMGTEKCLECHDFGLKFCDKCHEKKPPSHLPAGQWRALHPDAARADTRVCYTCHKTSFCKKCHVNHEAGWMKAHPAFVGERGDSSCTECHSASACAYCHTAMSQASAAATSSQ